MGSTQQIFIKHLLDAGDCSRPQGCWGDDTKYIPQMNTAHDKCAEEDEN